MSLPPLRLREGLGYLAISVLLFGGIWPVTKSALADATPLWFAFNRAAMAAVVTAVLLALRRRAVLPVPRDWPAVLAIGLLQLAGFFAMSHLALDYIPAGRTAVLANVTLFWLIPLSVWVLGERVSALQWVAVAAGLAGVLVLMQPWSLSTGAAALLPGYGMLLAASLFWSIAILVTRRFPPAHSAMELLPWCFGLAALILLPLALWREPGGGIGVAAWPQAVFVGAVAAPLGTWATIETGRRLSGTMASMGFLLVPTLGVTLSTLWLGEALGWDLLLGGALIAVSVVLAALGAAAGRARG
ncbi:DMT family transporter [Siccirubricoccus sp. KC 17139]|uniref:DMT family transporter n=1 Tax=Siccirubricoccus soli TaxID=2899147 RepID=A0ABT1D089_9PROT|nr:DMT family transporter [Siccirubricoccus soli]MCO6414700.1 DMT family transporter [Siccirubricoccus soli]MCP2680830.1 DMT family transporter [Siccirubricoccus soli]